MGIRLTNSRQVLWPSDVVPWEGYEIMPHSPVPESAPLRPRVVPSDALAPWEVRQLVDALAAGAEPARSVTSLRDLLARANEIYEGMTDIAEYVLGARAEAWDIVDATLGLHEQEPEHVLWRYGIDCGTIFVGKGLNRAGYVTQGVLWCNEHPALWNALARSQAAMRSAAPDSLLAHVTLNGAVRCPSCDGWQEIWVSCFTDVVTCSRCGRVFDATAVMRQGA